MAAIRTIRCHLFGEMNHHGHQYFRGDEKVHCQGRHEPGKPYISTRRRSA